MLIPTAVETAMPLSQSRRQFLQLSAALAAGVYGPLSFSDQSRLEGVDACVVGLLSSRECVPDLTQAIVDAGARVAAVCNKQNALADVAIDAVVIGSGVDAPEDAARMALERGLHVFSTNPLGRSIGEMHALTELAHRRGLLLRTGLLSPDAAAVQQVASLIETGALGTLREVVCWTSRSENDGAECTFRNRGCSVLNVPFLALGSRQTTSIYGAGSPTAADFPESMAVRYEFSGGSDDTPVCVTWYDGEWAPPYESIDDYSLSSAGALYLGQTGQLLDDPVTCVRVLFRDGEQPDELPSVPTGAHQALGQWLAACANASPTSIELEPADRVNAAVLAGLASYRVRQSLEWDGQALRARNCPAGRRPRCASPRVSSDFAPGDLVDRSDSPGCDVAANQQSPVAG
jgi:hypothetical protein